MTGYESIQVTNWETMEGLIEYDRVNFAKVKIEWWKIRNILRDPKLSPCTHFEYKIWKVGNLVSISSHNWALKILFVQATDTPNEIGHPRCLNKQVCLNLFHANDKLIEGLDTWCYSDVYTKRGFVQLMAWTISFQKRECLV